MSFANVGSLAACPANTSAGIANVTRPTSGIVNIHPPTDIRDALLFGVINFTLSLIEDGPIN